MCVCVCVVEEEGGGREGVRNGIFMKEFDYFFFFNIIYLFLASSSDMRTRAQPPSLSLEAFPAVTVPFCK